eukprot:g4622.t1
MLLLLLFLCSLSAVNGLMGGSQRLSASICDGAVQQELRFGLSKQENIDLADWICCHNHHLAEPSGFFQDYLQEKNLPLQSVGQVTDGQTGKNELYFYDSVCGVPLFRIEVSRTREEFFAESKQHGWPSFRPDKDEVFTDNIVEHSNGEITSRCGTHLGHNLPDGEGDRYCINLVCIAGVAGRRHLVSRKKEVQVEF